MDFELLPLLKIKQTESQFKETQPLSVQWAGHYNFLQKTKAFHVLSKTSSATILFLNHKSNEQSFNLYLYHIDISYVSSLCLSVGLSVHPSIYPSVHLPIYQSINLHYLQCVYFSYMNPIRKWIDHMKRNKQDTDHCNLIRLSYYFLSKTFFPIILRKDFYHYLHCM